ncbi:MAG: GBS Bsp-like repeat-containing protein [Christensenella sp.]|uniref:GBS Bsp-like repeat-containing protein n=1 Tax=Christensenella sp. TaxID=1935934 RepID=UPI002B2049C8|nr:GBS Bsp-like repeat-containing protein [Christensenella sp.]MEA5001890.1 GBS Bsp-like repeat-containing protein [Christensenella sp.]
MKSKKLVAILLVLLIVLGSFGTAYAAEMESLPAPSESNAPVPGESNAPAPGESNAPAPSESSAPAPSESNAPALSENGKFDAASEPMEVQQEPSSRGVSITPIGVTGLEFHVGALGVNGQGGVREVAFAVWSEKTGDVKWYIGNAYGGGDYGAAVSAVNHGKQTGKYYAQLYVTDNFGVQKMVGQSIYTITEDSKPPDARQVRADNFDAVGRYKHIVATGVSDPSSVYALYAIVYNEEQGEDVYYLMDQYDSSTWGFLVDLSEYNFHGGNYRVNVYGMDGRGNEGIIGSTSFYVTPAVTSISSFDVYTYSYDYDILYVKGVECNFGVDEVWVYAYNDALGEDYGVWYMMDYKWPSWQTRIWFEDLGNYASIYHADVYVLDDRGGFTYTDTVSWNSY